jgi:hypothetical protein
MKKLNPKNDPWFPFYSAAWLGSSTVTGMTMTERGIYITLMALCWQYGEVEWDAKYLSRILGIDRRTCGRFMEKYTDLTQTLHEGSKKRVLPKVQEFSETLRKNAPDRGTEESRRKSRLEQKDSAAAASKTEQQQPTTTPLESPSIPFDPFTFESELTSKSGVAFSSVQVKRILHFHFKSDDPFWKTRISSIQSLRSNIDTMAAQVPADWELPTPKPPKTRTVGDPTCANCRGAGSIVKRVGEDLQRVACDCPKHDQIAVGKVWQDVI